MIVMVSNKFIAIGYGLWPAFFNEELEPIEKYWTR